MLRESFLNFNAKKKKMVRKDNRFDKNKKLQSTKKHQTERYQDYKKDCI